MARKRKTNRPSAEPSTELVLSGEVTVGSLEELRVRFLQALDGHGLVRVSANDLTYIDAAALQFVWALRRECEERGRPLQIEPPSESVLKDVERLGMQRVFMNPGTS